MFFNKEGGCKFSAEDCMRPHVLYCTNKICVSTGKSQTHAGNDCGRKGGPKHSEWVAKKKSEAEVKVLEDPTVAVCEKLYVKVDTELKALADAVPESVKKSVKNLAGKIVGMFKEGLTLDELQSLMTNDTLLGQRMADAVDLLEQQSA